jgi:hypothetical protein
MARRAFFSFHHQRDNWRANQVRNSWITKEREAAGYWDAAEWEEVKKKDADSIHRWIDRQMDGTSVTVVLIGSETSTREHVGYEISQSHRLKKGIVGVRIHGLKNSLGNTDIAGANPLDNWTVTEGGRTIPLSSIYSTYDYVTQMVTTNWAIGLKRLRKKQGANESHRCLMMNSKACSHWSWRRVPTFAKISNCIARPGCPAT